MKKTFFAMMIALLAVAVMSAQPQRRARHHQGGMNPEKMIEHRVAMLDKELSLTPEQKTAIAAIYTEQSEQMKAEMQKMRGGKKDVQPKPEEMKARREQMEARQAEVDSKVAALLTDEQKAKFEQIKAKQGDRSSRMHKGHRGSGHEMRKAPQAKKADCCNDGKAKKAEVQDACCKDKAETPVK